MAKAMKHRDVERKLVTHGCVLLRTTGSHQQWVCPCGKHRVSIPNHRDVSPGVVRNTTKNLPCLPEGWLM